MQIRSSTSPRPLRRLDRQLFTLLVAALAVACAEPAKLGQSCKRDGDCASHQCLSPIEARVCTKECHSDAECGGGLACVPASSEYGHCAPPDAKGKGFGEPCKSSRECDRRLCVKELMDRDRGFCSALCADDDDCPDGRRCAKGVGDGSRFCQ